MVGDIRTYILGFRLDYVSWPDIFEARHHPEALAERAQHVHSSNPRLPRGKRQIKVEQSTPLAAVVLPKGGTLCTSLAQRATASLRFETGLGLVRVGSTDR